jgi:2Fe-2S ferredoxin
MPKVVYISPDGPINEVDVPEGTNLMQAAVSNGIYDIVGDCGGSASCATCHVYVDQPYHSQLDPPSDREEEMLGCTAAERRPNSRLSCQIVMTQALDGIRLLIADRQW